MLSPRHYYLVMCYALYMRGRAQVCVKRLDWEPLNAAIILMNRKPDLCVLICSPGSVQEVGTVCSAVPGTSEDGFYQPQDTEV